MPRLPLALLLYAAVLPLHATVVGTSIPAESITRARIATLPAAERQPWLDYLTRSEQQRTADRAALAAERKALATIPPLPLESGNAHTIPLNRDPAFYTTPEALHIADVILSFQTPAGGWSKNLDMATTPRLPGQSYTTDNLSKHLGPNDFDTPADPGWNYVGTLDNDATTTQIRYLGLITNALSGPAAAPYRTSFLRGIRYLLQAQFPNGGWPQVYPLEGGYHDAITFNDNAVTETATLLNQVAAHRFAWVCERQADDLCARSGLAVQRALAILLATQVRIHGKPALWAQQHDALTLVPVAGRNFEPAALSTGESADILLYLMAQPHPAPDLIAAVDGGIASLRASAIQNEEWSGTRGDPAGRTLKPRPGAASLWPRYLSLTTGKPIFGDRDKSIHDTVSELSLERRNGYAWYSSGPQKAIDAYAAWRKGLPRP